MGLKKKTEVEPFAEDEETRPLTDTEVSRLRPAPKVLSELGIAPPRPRGRPPVDDPKQQVTLRLDADIVAHFRSGGRGWQTRINAALRRAIKRAG
jgi:uncharacterized protein (DUF4415 family)